MCVLYPHTPHFYIVKLGGTGVYIFFYFTAVKYYTIIDLNEVEIRIYLPEKVIFTEAARPR